VKFKTLATEFSRRRSILKPTIFCVWTV